LKWAQGDVRTEDALVKLLGTQSSLREQTPLVLEEGVRGMLKEIKYLQPKEISQF
jgi:hypothetical protein